MYKNGKTMKLWNEYQLNKEIESFTVGKDYILDQKLVRYDCLGSIAHAKMLNKIGVLKQAEAQKIVRELNKIIILNERGGFKILKEEEDCHTTIENHLIKKLGTLGKKIHTGRSRNDQVLTALRLYYKDELGRCKDLVQNLIIEINIFVKKYGKIRFPGYTHGRKAMPSSVGLWADSFIVSMADNLKLIDWAFDLVDQSPLGTGAGYGLPIKVDREYTAKLLGFKKIQKNPIYVQNSRGKFESTILHALVQIMVDLNKIASDLIIFTMPELGYFKMPETFCTGSSIMPQKRNPDVLELLRGKYYVVASYESQVENMIGNLLSGYNRDLQLMKEPLINGFEITRESLSVAKLLIKNLKVDKRKCEQGLTEEIYATEQVYNLVKKGVPFREAYHKISKERAKKNSVS